MNNIFVPEQKSDGTFFLSKEQRSYLNKRPSLTAEKIYSALLKLYELSRYQEKEWGESRISHLPPCSSCGGLSLISTGNCHVCAQCGESQGCS